MAVQLFMKLNSRSNGEIQGSVTQVGFEGQIAVFNTKHLVDAPVSPTGLATGKRSHGVFQVSKSIDKASVLLLDSWNRNDKIEFVSLDCYRSAATGELQKYYSVRLENVRIVSVEQILSSGFTPDVLEQEIVCFLYQTILWSFEEGLFESMSSNITRRSL